MAKATVLIVDDEPEMLENIQRFLVADDFACHTLAESGAIDATLADVKPDIVITDLRMPNVDGLGVLERAKAFDPSLPILLITAHASVASAVEAIQEGAFDYLAKPFSGDQLSVAVERALRYRRLMMDNQHLREQVSQTSDRPLIGSSPPFLLVLDQVRRVGPTEANVLVTGESGTGKEVIARALHRYSRRADRPFVPVDCAALPEGLLESELFGHEKGAFTGAVGPRTGMLAEADGGTIFFDEIGELTSPLQAKLLRVLEEREVRPVGSTRFVPVNLRMIAATNRDLEEAVREGRFRQDLFYRLNVVHLTLPPLRLRNGDVTLLGRTFFREFAERWSRPEPEVHADVWRALERYEWPGNVRQLRNLVEQIVALDVDGKVTLSNLPPEIQFHARSVGIPETVVASLDYEEAREAAMHAFRETYVRRLLDAHAGNVSKAAKTAGVSRRTLHRWLAELGASPGEEEAEDDEHAGA